MIGALPALFERFALAPRGMIHAGAYHGEELDAYLAMGFSPILLLEANPAAYSHLQRRVSARAGRVRALPKAVSDQRGRAVLHLTRSETQSSLLTPLGGITLVDQVEVDCAPLLDLIEEAGFQATQFNLLVLDLQGAELRVMRACRSWLRQLDAILCEVNDEARYLGCPLLAEVDQFLADQGFIRRLRSGPFPGCPAGDAFYLNVRSLPFPGLA